MSLTQTNVLTLALVGQWTLSKRTGFVLVCRAPSPLPLSHLAQPRRIPPPERYYRDTINVFSVQVVHVLHLRQRPYDALACSGVLLAGFVQRASNTIERQQTALRTSVVQLQSLLAQNQHLHGRVQRAAARSTALNERMLRRISAELHDGPAQDVSLALLRLDHVVVQYADGGATNDDDAPRTHLDIIQNSLCRALQEICVISAGLGLPHLTQLTLTLQRAVRAHERRTGTTVALTIDVLPEHASLSIKITLYRVVQEALTNAYRHAAGAGQAVRAWCNHDIVYVDMQDQGPGFNEQVLQRTDEHLGLAGMRERGESLGGVFMIDTAPNHGTTIHNTCAPCRSTCVMSTPIRIVIVDDHPLFREGVVHTLRTNPAIDVVGEGDTADDVIRLATTLLPDLVLVDLTMPGGGLHATQMIATMCPATKIVILTASEEDDLVGALKAGARADMSLSISARELMSILQAVHAGNVYVPPGLATSLLMEMTGMMRGARAASNPLDELTERERQILEGVAAGLSNKEIAQRVYLSEKTVKHYMTNILQKLQVRNQVEAALLAQKGWRSDAKG